MATSTEQMLSLLGRLPTAREHSEICRCTMCMKNKISDPLVERHAHGLMATMVDRRNPDDPVRPLMKATESHAILRAGTTVDMLAATGLRRTDLPDTHGVEWITPREINVGATWKHRSVEAARSGRDASVFGGLGVLLMPTSFSALEIPKMSALAVPDKFLRKYGAELVRLDEPVAIDPVSDASLEDLYLVQYDFDKDYIEKYVLKLEGGGGLFVETHPFPHVFTPLSRECSGALILGVDRHDGTIDFAAFEIPFGFTLKIKANVIHGDSFFVGPYAIALTETELADSVLFKRATETRDIQIVKQVATPPLRLPILAEYRLAKAINHLLLVEKIRGEGLGKMGIEFFRALPTDVLTEVHGLAPAAQEAFDERLAIVPSTAGKGG